VDRMDVEVAPHDSVIDPARYSAVSFVRHNGESSYFV
jgi:hypothetical protein